MRIKLSEWGERTYSDKSRPRIEKLRQMAANDEIPGAFQTKTGRWFVDLDLPEPSTNDLARKVIGNDAAMLRVMGL